MSNQPGSSNAMLPKEMQKYKNKANDRKKSLKVNAIIVFVRKNHPSAQIMLFCVIRQVSETILIIHS